MLKIKNNVTEMKSVFNGLISFLGTAEGRICDIEDKSVETSLTEIKRENIMKIKLNWQKPMLVRMQNSRDSHSLLM